jgi:hypothetical protein
MSLREFYLWGQFMQEKNADQERATKGKRARGSGGAGLNLDNASPEAIKRMVEKG